MNDGINELDDLMQRAAATPWGKTCSSLWAQAAALAQESDDHTKAVRCYGELCAAYMMGGESTRVIAPFMWLDNMFKTHPEYFEEQDVQALGWYYKYVVSTLRCVPTVSVDQCNALLDEMRQYYMSHGDSMRAYHIRCYQFHRDMGQTEAAELSYIQWQNAEHSELSDCERCDPGYEVLYHAGRKEWDQAVAAGDKALAHDGDYCDSQPEALLTEMMEPWLRVGRDAEAWAAHIRAYRRYQQHPRYFEFLQDHWKYLALSGRAGRPERLERGLTIFLRHMPWWTEAEHPRLLMDSAVSAYILLDSFEGEDRLRVLPTTLPGEGLAWAPRENVENPTIEAAAAWMKKLALDLAAQFDARPGHLAAGQEKQRIMNRLAVEVPAPLPQRAGVEDVTGLGSYESSITILPRQTQTNEPTTVQDTPQSAASADEPREASPSADEAHRGDDTPQQVPLTLSMEWKELSEIELLERTHAIGKNCTTVFDMELGMRIRQRPELRQMIDPNVPDHLRPEWDNLCQSLDSAEDLDHDAPQAERYSDDPAYALVIAAEQKLLERDFFGAATLADKATRTESCEPIGVRCEALGILAVAAKEAGYLNESIESVRESVNLAALLGMENEQLTAMWYLGVVLRAARKFVEAAEVAQNALDIAERYPQMAATRIRLLEVAATANTKLEYHDAAGAYHQQAAQVLQDLGMLDRACSAVAAAAESYGQAHDFARAIEMRRMNVTFLRQLLAADELELELADPSDTEGYEAIEASLGASYQTLVKELLEYALAIVRQPGIVPPEDCAVMEEVMDEMRGFLTSPELDKWFEKTPEWREAEWRSDYAHMLWNCYQYTAALDQMRASIAGFAALNEVGKMAQYHMAMAYMYRNIDDIAAARENAETVLSLLDKPKWSSNQYKRAAKVFLRELGDAE